MATSRSGRLRKRSSKLADFDSSEESDGRSSKKGQDKNNQKENKSADEQEMEEIEDVELPEDEWKIPEDESNFLDKLNEEDFNEDSLNVPTEDDFDFNEDAFNVEEETGIAGKEESAGIAQSLYLSEKQSNKKQPAKDTKKKKPDRKDKGKTRFTAYMLWSREMRQEVIKDNPNLNFSSINKKLGEMWQAVPTAQKFSWKARAERYAVRNKQQNNGTAKGSEKGSKGKKKDSPTKKSKKSPHKKRDSGSKSNSRSKQGTGSDVTQSQSNGQATQSSHVVTNPPPTFRVTGTAAIDVASHMKLLGESLNNIGQKLREHEGHIAVSGSLSVLLDSMLCVLGPLMCLTDQVEETRGAIDKKTLEQILDNIAYIMPGIA